MSKEKIASLTKYVNDYKSKLTSPIPAKWAHSPVSYKSFLEREIAMASKKLDELKLSASEQKKG